MIELSVQNGAEQTFQSDLKGRAWPARAAEPMLAPPPAVLNIISVGKVATRAEQLSHRASPFEFSLCLSRACLGKTIIFGIKRRKRCVFVPEQLGAMAVSAAHAVEAVATLCRADRLQLLNALATARVAVCCARRKAAVAGLVNGTALLNVQCKGAPVRRVVVLRENVSFLRFPYVCPEPALAKCQFAQPDGAKKTFSYLQEVNVERILAGTPGDAVASVGGRRAHEQRLADPTGGIIADGHFEPAGGG